MNSSFSYVLQYLMSTGPMLLVTVVGLLLIVVNWQKLGRAALPAAAGFGLHLFASLAYLLASTMLVGVVNSGSATSTAMNFRILGVINGVLHASALALLLIALLTPRTPAE
jgi:hypothetical protein